MSSFSQGTIGGARTNTLGRWVEPLRIMVWNVQNLTNDRRPGSLFGVNDARLRKVALLILRNRPDLVVIMEMGSDAKRHIKRLCDWVNAMEKKVFSQDKFHSGFTFISYCEGPTGANGESYGILSRLLLKTHKLLELKFDKNIPREITEYIRSPVYIQVGDLALCVLHAPFTKVHEIHGIIGMKDTFEIASCNVVHRLIVLQESARAFAEEVSKNTFLKYKLFAGDFNIPSDKQRQLATVFSESMTWRESQASTGYSPNRSNSPDHALLYSRNLRRMHMQHISDKIGPTSIRKKKIALSQTYDQVWCLNGNRSDYIVDTMSRIDTIYTYRQSVSDHLAVMITVNKFTLDPPYYYGFHPYRIMEFTENEHLFQPPTLVDLNEGGDDGWVQQQTLVDLNESGDDGWVQQQTLVELYEREPEEEYESEGEDDEI